MKCTACSQDIKPIVAVDIDGTLGNYHDHFVGFASDYYDRELPFAWDGSGDWEDYLGLSRAEYREAKLAYRQGGQKRLMPVFEGARAMMAELHLAGAEVWLTTTRPWMRHDSTDPDTREWLRRNHIGYDHLLYDDDKYFKLATLVDPLRVVGVIDDLPGQIVRASMAFPLLIQGVVGGAVLRYACHNQTDRYLPGTDDLSIATKIFIARIEEWRETHE